MPRSARGGQITERLGAGRTRRQEVQRRRHRRGCSREAKRRSSPPSAWVTPTTAARRSDGLQTSVAKFKMQHSKCKPNRGCVLFCILHFESCITRCCLRALAIDDLRPLPLEDVCPLLDRGEA